MDLQRSKHSGFFPAIYQKILHISYRWNGRKTKFGQIYARGGFSGGGMPSSGEGSTLKQTKIVRAGLATLLMELNVRTIVDAPCGDFNWMKEVDLTNCNYVGIDIVEELIKKNNDQYARAKRKFLVGDIVKDRIPTADLT